MLAYTVFRHPTKWKVYLLRQILTIRYDCIAGSRERKKGLFNAGILRDASLVEIDLVQAGRRVR